MTHAGKILIILGVLTAGLLGSPQARGSERDVHYLAVLVLGRLSGVDHDDALLIARASQSSDENAETSPLPENRDLKSKASMRWYERTAVWHSLPKRLPNLMGKIPTDEVNRRAKQQVKTQLDRLYKRALNEKNRRTANIYFGQYVHALADSVTHEGYGNVTGHLRAGHTPDIPLPENRNNVTQIMQLVAGALTRFQRDRFGAKPKPVSSADIDKIVGALAYAAPAKNVPLHIREMIARRRLERLFPGVSIPEWDRVGPLVFDIKGNERTGPRHPPRDVGKFLSIFWGPTRKIVKDITRQLNAAGEATARLAQIKDKVKSLVGDIVANNQEADKHKAYCKSTVSKAERSRRLKVCVPWEKRINLKAKKLTGELSPLAGSERRYKKQLADARTRLVALRRQARIDAVLGAALAKCRKSAGLEDEAKCYVDYYGL